LDYIENAENYEL